MHIIDKHACIECGFCALVCPKEAIKKAKVGYEIKDSCVNCGLCAKKCPVNAIEKQ